MTKKPFVGQSAIAKGLLDLVHTDVCGPLSIPARGGFSYFITFTDDHSQYGYVYLMRSKSEDRGGEYLSGEFIDYLKENGILSQWTPPRMPQLNGVAERRNRTLLDMVRSMMSFTKLPLSFWGHALEMAVKLLNISPSKSIPQTPYEIWHGKACLLQPSKRFLSREMQCSWKRIFHRIINVMRSTRESRVPKRYGFMGLTSQLDKDPKTYGEAMSDKWLEAIKFEMDSMGSNKVWTLVDPPKGVRPVGCKWVYKRKLGSNGEVTAFKARLVAKGYTQRPGIDFEKTYLPVAMAKSIRILLAIAA
ncbi:UNVERIFIED_CONTAM: Retrovirus-related Pol polyprotein from transposon RE2 [Sesamum latifolium]|uniref:Retrovirus-related Pol polyprotein from transposon RE2 n=1 Tax=Sesamum latifolium TaxID=2727402 RepID=A0AAW2WW12_9LAMI